MYYPAPYASWPQSFQNYFDNSQVCVVHRSHRKKSASSAASSGGSIQRTLSSTRDRSERDNRRKRNVKDEGNIGPHGSALDFGLPVLYTNPISEHVFDDATPSRFIRPSFFPPASNLSRKYSYAMEELFETGVP